MIGIELVPLSFYIQFSPAVIMAAPKRPLEEVDANIPPPQRLRTSGPAADTRSSLSTTPERQVRDIALLPSDISVTTADRQHSQHGTESTVKHITTPTGNTDVQATSSSDAQQTAPPQGPEDHQPISEIVGSDRVVP